MARKSRIEQPLDTHAFIRTKGLGKTILNYRKDQVVFAQGDPADSVYYVQQGNVKIKVNSRRGKEAVIGLLGAGSFFGEGCLTAQQVRMATALAMDDCTILRIAKERMILTLHEDAAFGEMFLKHLLSRNTRIEEDLVDQLFNSSEKRLARVLLLLSNFGTEGTPHKIIPKMSQETLAEIVGTTRSRVSFFMNRFRELGFIDYNGGLEVHSSLLNVVLHD
jgi:CRP/FNR family cyclic AMP-dependent transcriptional regulator